MRWVCVNITDRYVYRNPVNNAIDWEDTTLVVVDRVTGRHIEEAYSSDYFLFPRNVEQITYSVRNTTYEGVPVEFQHEEVVSGILTYVFTYRGNFNNMASYVDYDLELEVNQTITCFGMELSYWVEPRTGEVIKFRELCPVDYVVDTTNGEQLYVLARWTGESLGDDLIRRANEVGAQLAQYNLLNVYLPLGLLIGGLLMLALGGWMIKQSAQDTADKETAV